MNFLLYVVLFIISSPKFFMILRGRRVASITLTDIFFHALLFTIGIYIVRYLTRTFHILEGFEDASSQNAGNQGENNNISSPLDQNSKTNEPVTEERARQMMTYFLTEQNIRKLVSENADGFFKDPNTLAVLKALNLKKKDVLAMLKCTAPKALKQYVKPKVVNKIITDTLKPYNF